MSLLHESIQKKLTIAGFTNDGCLIAATDFATRGEVLSQEHYETYRQQPVSEKSAITLLTQIAQVTGGNAYAARPPFNLTKKREMNTGIRNIIDELQVRDLNERGITLSFIALTNKLGGHSVTLFNGPGNSIGLFDPNTQSKIQRVNPKSASRILRHSLTRYSVWQMLDDE